MRIVGKLGVVLFGRYVSDVAERRGGGGGTTVTRQDTTGRDAIAMHLPDK